MRCCPAEGRDLRSRRQLTRAAQGGSGVLSQLQATASDRGEEATPEDLMKGAARRGPLGMSFGGGTLPQICRPAAATPAGKPACNSHQLIVCCVTRLPSCPPSLHDTLLSVPRSAPATASGNRRMGRRPCHLASGAAAALLSRSMHFPFACSPFSFCDAHSFSCPCPSSALRRCAFSATGWRQTTRPALASEPPHDGASCSP